MRRVSSSLLISLLVSFAAAAAMAAESVAPGLYAEISTARGTITAELFFQRAPLTVTNFLGLAEGALGPVPRKPFFDGLTFHRVVPGFVVQGGDPLGTGAGGPGYTYPDEFVPGLRHDKAGVLSMANSGPDTNGSQFFITLSPVNRLNYLHSVFGQVVRGMDVLPQIQPGDRMTVKILRVGAAAETFRATAETFAALSAKAPRARPAHFDDPDGVLPTDPPRAKAFDVKLANVERATGLKLFARVFETFTPSHSDERIDSAARALAAEMQLDARSALAVYFQNNDTWDLWIGDRLVPALTKDNAAGTDAAKQDRSARTKQDLLTAARTQSDAVIADAVKKAPADKPVSTAQKTKLHVDAVLDALIFRLEPFSP